MKGEREKCVKNVLAPGDSAGMKPDAWPPPRNGNQLAPVGQNTCQVVGRGPSKDDVACVILSRM